MHIYTKKSKENGFINRLIYRVFHQDDIADVVFDSENSSERQKLLNKLIEEEMTTASIYKEEIPTHIEDFEEFTIQHIYADMQVLKKSFIKIKKLSYIKEIKYNNKSSHYSLMGNNDTELAYVSVDDYTIKLVVAGHILDEKESIEILNFCIDEISKIQFSSKNIINVDDIINDIDVLYLATEEFISNNLKHNDGSINQLAIISKELDNISANLCEYRDKK